MVSCAWGGRWGWGGVSARRMGAVGCAEMSPSVCLASASVKPKPVIASMQQVLACSCSWQSGSLLHISTRCAEAVIG